MRELVQLIETEGREKLVLNLSSVEFLASAALGELIAVHKKVAARNGILKLCCVHPELGRLFTVTRLDSLFNIAASEADAVAARPAGGIENCRSCRSGFRLLLTDTTAATFPGRRPRRCGRSAGRPSGATSASARAASARSVGQTRQVAGQFHGDPRRIARACRPISSGRPRFVSWLRPARPTTVRPTSVTTGTPIQKESRLVVWPL